MLCPLACTSTACWDLTQPRTLPHTAQAGVHTTVDGHMDVAIDVAPEQGPCAPSRQCAGVLTNDWCQACQGITGRPRERRMGAAAAGPKEIEREDATGSGLESTQRWDGGNTSGQTGLQHNTCAKGLPTLSARRTCALAHGACPATPRRRPAMVLTAGSCRKRAGKPHSRFQYKHKCQDTRSEQLCP